MELCNMFTLGPVVLSVSLGVKSRVMNRKIGVVFFGIGRPRGFSSAVYSGIPATDDFSLHNMGSLNGIVNIRYGLLPPFLDS